MAKNFSELRNKVLRCCRCGLRGGASRVVPGAGDENADVLWIGEAPGRDEDVKGIPFIGRSGRILRNYIFKDPLGNFSHFITNIVKCRPPDNRNPAKNEIESCMPHLLAQLDLVKPLVIVTLGNYSMRTLTQKNLTITKCHGSVMGFENIPLFPLYHPAYLLYNRKSLKDFETDLDKLISLIKSVKK